MTSVEKKPANAPKKAGKKLPRTAWKKGESGNAAGKKPGTLNKMTVLSMTLLAKDLQEITKKVVSAALEGDMQAARFIIERMVPPMRERPVSVNLPATDSLEGIGAAQQAILDAVGRGDLLPGEGTTLSGIVEQRRKAIETVELERRIATLEGRKK